MMERFPRYEHYKDSGVSWIEEIPFSWKTERAKWLFQKMERPIRPKDEVVTAFRDGQVTLRKNRREEGFTNALQEHGYQGLRKGDLVIHAMDAFAGAIGVSDSDGKSTPVYSACIPRGKYYVNNYYYAYLLRYMSRSGFIQALAKGIRERSTDFRFNDFANLCLPIPSQEEQDRIVTFLDQKTAEIDEAIGKKKRLIELLKEQKAILINQAVTKGLNPNAPMRNSGVEWIGEIPVHWEVRKVKALFKSMDYGLSESAMSDGEYKYLNMGHIRGGEVIVADTGFLNSVPSNLLLDTNDILFNRTNSFDLVGKSGIYKGSLRDKVTFASYLVRLRTTEGYNSDWANYLLNDISFLGYARGLALRSLHQANLNPNRLGAIHVPVPPSDEQTKIAEALMSVAEQYESQIEATVKGIDSYHDLKRSYIAEAVTGKIKV